MFSTPTRPCSVETDGVETDGVYALFPAPFRACGGGGGTGERGVAYTIPCVGIYEGMYAFPCGAAGTGAALTGTVGPDAAFTLSRAVT